MKVQTGDRVVELRWEREPCPDRPELTQRRHLVCEWGPFVNAEADPRLGLDKLILITQDSVERMLANGPEPAIRGPGMVSASTEDGRTFVHLDYEGERSTWELFAARIKGNDRTDVLVGRWPD